MALSFSFSTKTGKEQFSHKGVCLNQCLIQARQYFHPSLNSASTIQTQISTRVPLN